MSPLLSVRGLSVEIGGKRVCEHLDMGVHPGQCWAILGRNGVGKTTLLHHLGGLRHDHHGSVHLDGSPLEALKPRDRARQVGFLLQHSSRGFGASVLQSVLTGRHPHLATLAWEGRDDLAIAERQIAALDLARLADRSLDTLSGGELRRVEIARLLTQQPRLALLDEPMNHLDLAHQATSLRVLRTNFVTPRRAMIMIVHDLNLAAHACDHWLILNGDGSWQAGPRAKLCDPGLLGRAFGHPIERLETAHGPALLTPW